ARGAARVKSERLAVEGVVPVDAVECPEGQQRRMGAPSPEARELAAERSAHASREPFVQVTDHDARARPLVPENVALHEPLDLRRALALAEAQVHVQDVESPAVEVEIGADPAARLEP